MAAELTGWIFACRHASLALRLNASKNLRAKRNSVDQIHRPSSTGGIVSGPGSTARAAPSAVNAGPREEAPMRYAAPMPGVRRPPAPAPPPGVAAGGPGLAAPVAATAPDPDRAA